MRAATRAPGRTASSCRSPNRTERCGTGQQLRRASALVTATLSRGSVGVYQLQAAIAAVHDEAPRAEDTDWPQILALYGLLKRMADNPMVTLNHAIAAAMVNGPVGWAEVARSARQGSAARRPLPSRRRSRALARDGRQPGGSDCSLSGRCRPHRQRARTELPHDQGGEVVQAATSHSTPSPICTWIHATRRRLACGALPMVVSVTEVSVR